MSFLADLLIESSGLQVEVVNVGRLGSADLQEVPAATYKQTKVMVGDPGGIQFPRSMWLRVPLLDEANKYPCVEVSAAELLSSKEPIVRKLNAGNGLEMVLVSRGG